MVQVRTELTAIKRKGLSAPMNSIYRSGLLHSGTSLLDYGCGRGGDVEYLESFMGAVGYDPHPKFGKTCIRRNWFDIVTMIYVINVIPDPQERANALAKAWSYVTAGGYMYVAARSQGEIAMLARRHSWKSHNDGWLTSRGTFQRGFSNQEMHDLCPTQDVRDYHIFSRRGYRMIRFKKLRRAV